MFPMFVLPQFGRHEVNLPLAAEGRLMWLLSFAGAVETLDMKRTSTDIQPLMFTSPQAFGRINPDLESNNYHEGDDIPRGQRDVAVAVTDTVYVERTQTTQIIVVSSGDIWSGAPREIVGDNNFAFVASGLRWLTGQGPGLFIPTRTPPGEVRLTLNQFQANTVAGFAMGVLPLATLAAGIIVWLRRRHS
jgi:hypothetical protein